MSGSRHTNPETIDVIGAREHNLKNIDVAIPIGKLVAFTGVSGSGKSSLLYDTLYAEGRSRLLRSLTRRSRKLLPTPTPPDVERIEGLPPILALSQERGRGDHRGTFATLTDLAPSLRLLYSRLGIAHCPRCGKTVSRQSVDEIVERILRLEDRKKVMILAPVVRGKKGSQKALLEEWASRGYVRVRIDGEIQELSPLPELAARKKHSIEVIIDRIIVKEGIEDRLHESVSLALREASETCLISENSDDSWEDRLYSSRYACAECDLSFPPLESRSFSRLSPYGWCETCEGTGTVEDSEEPCPACEGEQLNEFVRAVQFEETRYPELLALSATESKAFFENCATTAEDETEQHIRERILPEIRNRLDLLEQVGLGYLTLDRPMDSLSGGEFQRARLASVLAGGLVGAAYLLDEPTRGLHPSDADRLQELLVSLRDKGNSVLFVEHDLGLIAQADHVIELGPGAGAEGGELIATGTPDDIRKGTTLTGHALQQPGGAVTTPRTPSENSLSISGANRHNLIDLDVTIPLSRFVCLTGVSGSGKSTLVHDVIAPSLRKHFDRQDKCATNCQLMSGMEHLTGLREIDQSPLGRSGRSNPATATGLWTEVRRIFSGTKEAKLRGFAASRFSFSNSEGRCETCKGRGERVQRMPLLPPVRTVCPACRGKRFNEQTLSVLYKGHSVADVLDLRLDDARTFFENFPVVSERLNALCDLGLGYLSLGQPAPTLSGGESQRIKLAAELGRLTYGPTLFLLDEPTSGLHPADVENLLTLLQRLVDEGHSLLVIEHQPSVMLAADWIIDLGPGAGSSGGQLVAEGTPEQVASESNSATGRVLKELLG